MNHYTNKKSLARLGHGKWKSVLGHTLLIIGMVLMSVGAFAQAPTNGLYLNKTWTPDPTDPNGSTGVIRLETFVTGDKIITEEHIPTDIVLVLDVSGSMNDYIYNYQYNALPEQGYSYNSYGNNNYYYLYEGQYYAVQRSGNRYRNLRFQVNGTYYYLSGTGVTTTRPTNVTQNQTNVIIWTGVLYERTLISQQRKLDALKTSVKQFVSIIAKDAAEFEVDHRLSIIKYASNSYYDDPQSPVDPEADLSEGNHKGANGNNNYNYTEVLINRRNAENDSTYIMDEVDALTQGGATAADFGMNKARYLLASIPHVDNPDTPENEDEFSTRNKIVVMFTDGSPTHQSNFDNTVANNTIGYAYQLKNSGTISGTNYAFGATVFTVGVFDNETEQIHTYMERTSSNYPTAQNMTSTYVPASDHYYFEAKSAEALSDIFEAIAGESGSAAMPMGVGTIVQDVISPSFQLNIPEGATALTTIKSYAPKCIGKDGSNFTFENEIDGATRLQIGTDDEGNEGVVIGGAENRLPDTIVKWDPDNKTIQFKYFNFEAMYVAEEKDEQGTPLGIYTGRKLVMLIPLEIGDGSWGDGINTNGPLSVIYPDGDTLNPIAFNNPTANVLGSVWTEVITTRPPGFPEITGDGSNQTVEIDSPEDLAWFISEVNGRIGYNVKDGYNSNNVASHPKLNGKLTADIDMSRHNWVPIGCGWQVEIGNDSLTQFIMEGEQKVHMTYEGTFDGNGHVITGLKNNASKYYKQITQNQQGVVVFPGMFSDVKGTIKNVFVLDADFRGKHHNENFVHHGIIADTLEAGGNIFNCEAAGRITCNNDDKNNDSQLIYGGLVGLNNGGTIHSCMAMAELTAYTMGGMIGENRGSFSNGFTNGVYNYLDNGVTDKFAGGIAATNTGTINNCYVRFERDNSNLDKMGAGFGMICGNNTGTVSNAYTPQIVTFSRPDYASATTAININTTVPTTAMAPGDNDENSYTLTISPSFYNMFTNDNSTGGTWGTLGSFNVYEQGTPLLTKLNNEAQNIDGAAAWKRTTAGRYTYNDLTGYTSGDINDDYPVLQFATFGEDAVTCLGSADGIRIDYATSLNEMLHRHNNGAMNENTQISNEFTASSADYYKVSGHAAINGGAINLYANDDVTLQTTGGKDGVADNCTAEGVVVYIDENTSLLQDATSTIEAYTGQTLKAFDNNTQQSGDRWHFISSSLEESQFGWSYLVGDAQIPYLDPGQTYTYNEYTCTSTDPCKWNLNNHDEDYAFYPIDLSSYARADFYCFYEPQYHWINFRRNSSSHWHMDNSEVQITYNNEDHFLPGKGYLTTVDMSQWWSFNLHGNTISKQEQFIQNRGTLNHENVEIEVTASAPAWTGLQGYNLLGNPYQSYLDFDEFVSGNAELMANSKFANTYGVYDPSQSNYIQYLSGSSVGANTASKYINMHQGFFIQVNNGGTAIFNNDMRTNDTDSQTGFRGAQPAFPLVNFTLTDANGNTDLAVLEVGRPENDGAKKLRMGSSTGRISLRHDNENCAILFRDMTEGSQPLYFDADEDGMFTLSWNTANADFRELTLVDNITGVRYDMLSHDSYVFEGHANDYKSRFKVVIGSFTGVEEEETVTNNFAFFDGSEWVVNGQGRLTVTDMMGRMVYSTNLENDQNRVNLNGVAQGMYLMQVSNSDGSRVQKIVVR